MKKWIILAVTCGVLLVAYAVVRLRYGPIWADRVTLVVHDSQTLQDRPFVDKEGGYQLRLPKGWTLTETRTDEKGRTMVSKSKATKSNLSVKTAGMEGHSFQTYARMNIRGLSMMLHNVKITEDARTTAGGAEAWIVTMAWAQDGVAVHGRQLYVKAAADEKMHIVTVVTPEAEWNEYAPVIESCLATFSTSTDVAEAAQPQTAMTTTGPKVVEQSGPPTQGPTTRSGRSWLGQGLTPPPTTTPVAVSVDQALAQMASSDATVRLRGAETLWHMTPVADRQDGVNLQVLKLMVDENALVRAAAARALKLWANDNTVEALTGLLQNPDPQTRRSAMSLLEKFPTEASADAVAGQLGVDAFHASGVLRRMGKVAEQPALKQITNPDRKVRIEVCRVLKAVGTSQSVPALQEAAKDTDTGVARAAEEALKAIAGRG